MAYQFVDTPRTEARGRSSAANLSFSDVHQLSSPSKEAQDARKLLRSRPGVPDSKTPRPRSALRPLRNPAARNEFTPLLKSAAQNRFRNTSQKLGAFAEESENNTDELVNSMLAGGARAAPETPAYLRSARKSNARTPAMPIDSSIVGGENTASSVEHTSLPPAIASSTVLSSPMPETSADRQGRNDRSDVLTLRQQEVKLEKLDKENFNLKLKIHFLDEMLTKTGTDYQQEIIKQNTDLKVERTTLTQDIRQQAKKLAKADSELAAYKQQLIEYAEKVKKRHTDEIVKEEMDRLNQVAQQDQQRARDLEQQVDSLQQRLELAEQGTSDKATALHDDIADLEHDLRERERQIEQKDDRIEELENDIASKSNDQQQLKAMQDEVVNLEAELDEKDQDIEDLKSQLTTAGDREKSTRKLRYNVEELETQLRDKTATVDEQDAQLSQLRKDLQQTNISHEDDMRQLQSEVRDRERSMQYKVDEIAALQERLDTARGSWDAEAVHADARLQERDSIVKDKETELRHALQRLDEHKDQIKTLQQQLQNARQEIAETSEQKKRQAQQLETQVSDLQSKLREVNTELDAELDSKDQQLRDKDAELARIISQLQAAETRVARAGSPSKVDVPSARQTAEIARLERLCDAKAAELKELERALSDNEIELDNFDKENLRLRAQVEALGNKSPVKQDSSTALQELERKLEGQLRVAEERAAAQQKTNLEAQEALNDEIVVLEASAEDALSAKDVLEKQVKALEGELTNMRRAKESETPRERGEMRRRLRDSDLKCADLERQIQELEQELDQAASKARSATPMRERDELRRKLATANTRIEQLEARVSPVKASKTFDDGREMHDLIRDSKIEAEGLRIQIEEQDKRIASLLRKDGQTRARLDQARADLEARDVLLEEHVDKLSATRSKETQLRTARDRIVQLETQIEGLNVSDERHDKREQELKTRLRDTRAELQDLRQQLTDVAQPEAQPSSDKTHEKELRGLAKQIQYLRAKCSREEAFRRDLVFSKKWFLLQIAMYGECNKADLRILEEIGVTPNTRMHQGAKKKSIKSVALAVIAAQRMQKMQAAWAGNKRLHETLMKKLEGMKKRTGNGVKPR